MKSIEKHTINKAARKPIQDGDGERQAIEDLNMDQIYSARPSRPN